MESPAAAVPHRRSTNKAPSNGRLPGLVPTSDQLGGPRSGWHPLARTIWLGTRRASAASVPLEWWGCWSAAPFLVATPPRAHVSVRPANSRAHEGRQRSGRPSGRCRAGAAAASPQTAGRAVAACPRPPPPACARVGSAPDAAAPVSPRSATPAACTPPARPLRAATPTPLRLSLSSRSGGDGHFRRMVCRRRRRGVDPRRASVEAPRVSPSRSVAGRCPPSRRVVIFFFFFHDAHLASGSRRGRYTLTQPRQHRKKRIRQKEVMPKERVK